MMEQCNGFEIVESKFEHGDTKVKEMISDLLERFATQDADMLGA